MKYKILGIFLMCASAATYGIIFWTPGPEETGNALEGIHIAIPCALISWLLAISAAVVLARGLDRDNHRVASFVPLSLITLEPMFLFGVGLHWIFLIAMIVVFAVFAPDVLRRELPHLDRPTRRSSRTARSR